MAEVTESERKGWGKEACVRNSEGRECVSEAEYALGAKAEIGG